MTPSLAYTVGGILIAGSVILVVLAIFIARDKRNKNLLLMTAALDAALGIGMILYGMNLAGNFNPAVQVAQKASENATAFMKGPGKEVPLRSDPGTGIRLYGEAYRFYQQNREAIPEERRAEWEKWTVLPERPQRLLGRTEELTYMEYAVELRKLIQDMARRER